MMIDSNTIVSMTEANQNFSMVTRIVDQYGTAVIFKNNKPRYEIRIIDQESETETTSDENVLAVSKKILKRNAAVYEELAK
ncbi:MAG: type II toxin-antitoxin system Phd/YefM family antitoxin [Oscillospiraceae bacterium]|nr:type II toxin-antitoxin system Phd/YefM family antitoxin [Oscillospiraceae bacterium]